MSLSSVLSELWEVVPILLLLGVGGLIALRSGADRPATGRNIRQIARNFSQMILRVAGYVAVLFALQYWIGQRPCSGGKELRLRPKLGCTPWPPASFQPRRIRRQTTEDIGFGPWRAACRVAENFPGAAAAPQSRSPVPWQQTCPSLTSRPAP